jgi:hypothetical protein
VRLARLLLHVALLLLGVAVGCLGSFVHAQVVAGLPVGLLCAYALMAAALATAGLATRARTGPAATAAGWLLALLLLSAPRPEGDLVVAGDLPGYAWSLGGLVLAALAVAAPWPVLASGQPAPGR